MTALTTIVAGNFVLAAVLALVVALLCLAPAVARRPALRHALWLLVLVKLITPPLAPVPILPARDNSSNTSAADVDPVPVSETVANHQSREADSIPSELAVVPAASLEPAIPPAGIAPTVEPRPVRERPPAALPTSSGAPGVERSNSPVVVWWRTPMTLLAVSLLGTLVLLWRGWRRMSRLSRMLHRAGTSDRLGRIVRDAAAAMRLAEAPAVSVVEAHLSPLLWVGRRGPIVVLPAKLVDELNDEQLLDVVRHEIAHYLRRDHWSNGLAFLITALWWWNPVAWWTRNRLRAAQELCCDAMVIDGSASTRRRYAETLLKVLDFLQSDRPALPAVGTGFGGSGPVRRRFEMIADADLSHRWSRRSMLVVLCATALLPWLPTTRAQDEPDDSPPAESGVGDHHDPSEHGAIGEAAFVREVIGRYDPDFWQEEDRIRELHRAGLAVLSSERDWLALVRDGEFVVIEVRTGHVAQRERLEEEAEQIEWLPGGVRVATADGGEIRFDVTPQVIRLLDARGRVEIVNSVVTAEVGYSDRLPAWSTWPTPDGEISLAGLPAGEHWLVTTPTYLDVLRVRVPGDEPLLERRQRAPTTNRSTDVNGRLSVRWDEEAGDILRIEVENRTGDVFRFSEQDLLLEAGTRRYSSHFVLSPGWVSDQSEPVPEVAIEDGQTGAMEIRWRDWVRDGLWVSRYGDVLAEPSLPEPIPGRMFVRLRGPYFGSLPVDVAHPMNERNAPFQGTWRLFNVSRNSLTVILGDASERSEMAINRQMIVGVPVHPLDRLLNRFIGFDMLSHATVSGMYSINDTTSPKTLAVELQRQTGTLVQTEQRAYIYRFEEATVGRDLVLAFDPEHPDKAPATWDSGPLAIFRFRQSERPENIDNDAGGEDPGEIPEAVEQVETADVRLQGVEVTPEAIAELAGREWDSVSLIGAEFNGEVIERLRHVASIRALQLTGDGLSGQVPRLENVPGLVSLQIGAPLRVRDLEAIGRLTQLERLSLPQELALTVTGAREIARLTNLKSLGLYNVDIDDASFAELGTLVNLEELDLSHTRITDDGLQVLARMPRLKSLELRRHPKWHIPQQISDACVPVICGLTELESLSLSGGVTNAGLVRIAALPRLKRLSIVSTEITGEGLAALEDSTVERLTLGSGQLGRLPPGIEKDEDILRFMPGLDSIRRCRSLKSVHVIGEADPRVDFDIWQRLAPNVDWGASS